MKDTEYADAANIIINVNAWIKELLETEVNKKYKVSKASKELVIKILTTWHKSLKKDAGPYKNKERAAKISAFIKAAADLLK